MAQLASRYSHWPAVRIIWRLRLARVRTDLSRFGFGGDAAAAAAVALVGPRGPAEEEEARPISPWEKTPLPVVLVRTYNYAPPTTQP